MFKATWKNKEIKAILIQWGVITDGGKKYLVGKSADGFRHQSTSLESSFDRKDGFIYATTRSGSVYMLLESGRDDQYATSRFEKQQGGIIGHVLRAAKGEDVNWEV